MKSIVNEGLRILLKEVLRNTRPEDAHKLMEAYYAEKVINVSIATSMYGDPDTHQCSFHWSIPDPQEFRDRQRLLHMRQSEHAKAMGVVSRFSNNDNRSNVIPPRLAPRLEIERKLQDAAGEILSKHISSASKSKSIN